MNHEFNQSRSFGFISVSGYGSTGSSAIVDFLAEHAGIYEFPGEFRLLQDPDGLLDLCVSISSNWGWLQCDAYIRRFIAFTNILARRGGPFSFGEKYERIFAGRFLFERDRFLARIIDVKSPGYWPYHDYHDANPLQVFWEKCKRTLSRTGFSYHTIRRLTKRRDLFFVRHDVDIFAEAREFLFRLFEPLANANSATFVLLDQGFLPYNRHIAYALLPDLKFIIVNRDPRDTYLDARSYNAYPITANPEDFISFYDSSHGMEPQGNDEQALFVQFESVVESYEMEAQRIRRYVGIDEQLHTAPRTRLDPERSITNLRTYKAAVDSAAVTHIRAIEEGLAEWLY